MFKAIGPLKYDSYLANYIDLHWYIQIDT